MDFSETTEGYATSPEDRLRGHLVADLRRHYPDRYDVQFGRLAAALAAEFTRAAEKYDINHYVYAP